MSQDRDLTANIMKEIAHQWRQPLSQINSNVFAIDNILDELNIKDIRLQERLTEVENLTKYMSQTIDDLNNNINSDKSFYMDNLLQNIKKNLAMSMKDSLIELSMHSQRDFLCKGKQGELLQVITIIINNAKDALIEKNVFAAKINVFAQQSDNIIRIKIIDNAGGMTKKNIDKIFDNEYSTKHSSEGSGLGLSMAKNIIVERFLGTISVQNLDKGSCFEISYLN